MEDRSYSLNLGSELSALDVEQMVEMYIFAFSEAPWFETWSKDDARLELNRSIRAGYKFMVCRIEELVIGFGIGEPLTPQTNSDHKTIIELGIRSDEYYVGELVTHQNFRKKGVCSGIMNAFIKHAMDSRYRGICLRTRENNEALFGVMERCNLVQHATYEATTGGVASKRILFHLPFN